MRELIWQLLAILLFLCGSAFFSAAEMSLSAANRMRLENSAGEGDRAAACAVAVLDRFERALSAILIGNNLCNIGSDSLATVVTAALLSPRFTPVSTVVMVLIVITFCETVPKILAKKNANRYSVRFAYFIRGLMIVLTPVTLLVSWLIHLLTLPFKGEKRESGEEEAAAELQSIIETVEDEGVIDGDRGEMLRSALDFSQVPVMDVMTARVDMLSLDVDEDWEELCRIIAEAPYSRIPVYEDSIDNIIGVLYLNRFFRALLDNDGQPVDMRELLFRPLHVYKTVKLPEVLRILRESRQHLAVVTDEYGGTLGIVSLEDVMEQIVGDIWDETDTVETEITECGEGVYELQGDMPVSDLTELLEIREDELETESATVGGWTIESFGGFPHTGDSFIWNQHRITVLGMDPDGLRVERVLLEERREEE